MKQILFIVAFIMCVGCTYNDDVLTAVTPTENYLKGIWVAEDGTVLHVTDSTITIQDEWISNEPLRITEVFKSNSDYYYTIIVDDNKFKLVVDGKRIIKYNDGRIKVFYLL